MVKVIVTKVGQYLQWVICNSGNENCLRPENLLAIQSGRRQHPVHVLQWIRNYPKIDFFDQDIQNSIWHCFSPNWNARTICISAGEDFVESSHQVAVNSSSTKTCVSIAIMNNRAVEETVETFMVVLHSSDPHVMLNPGATVSINDSSSKSVLIW